MDSLVIADLFVLLFLGLADNQMIAALLPSLLGSLHVSVGVAGLLVAVYSLTAALASFISGVLSDHYGRRRFLLFGVLLLRWPLGRLPAPEPSMSLYWLEP